MKLMNNLFSGKGYIDGITIINLEGEILFSAKFNNKLSSEVEGNYEIVGKPFLDVYEDLSPEVSTTYRAMTLGMSIYQEHQVLKAKEREEICISSLSIPIKSGNSIVGAIDLSVSEYNDPEYSKSQDIKAIFAGNNHINKLHKQNSARYESNDIISNNYEINQLKKYIKIAASCDLPTLIYGETGTGKELFAHAIHTESTRKSKPFISQNCAAIPENLLESILFGTSKGAFTGAIDNIGLIEMADKGTILLDEINSMPLHLQSKLLRVLEEGTIRRIGSKLDIPVDVKIIAALNENPMKCIKYGHLRKDIYYRLSALNFNIPPLRKRKDDIPVLVNYFVQKHNYNFNKNIKYVCQNLLDALAKYNWPGNIRELENTIIYGMSTVEKNKECLYYEDIKVKLEELSSPCEPYEYLDNAYTYGDNQSLNEMLQIYEKNIIKNALDEADGNISKAAQTLSVPRQTLQRKVQKYNLT